MTALAKDERTQLAAFLAFRIDQCRARRDTFPIHSSRWWYWKGKTEEATNARELVLRAWRKPSLEMVR